MESLEIVDDYTLKAAFKTTDLNFLKELMKIPGMQIDSLDDNGSFVDHTGTGPFILTDYEENVEATLVRNDDYWDTKRLPRVTKVKWIVIPDADARVMALESGQVDAIGITENTSSVPNSSVAALRGNESYQILQSDENSYDCVFSVGMNWKRAPLDDVNLRKAIGYAVDRETLVDTVYFGVPAVCGHMMNPAFDDGSDQVDVFRYDLNEAKKILSEGGYVLENGVLSRNGTPIELEYVTTTETEDADLAVFIQSALKDIGITVNITTFDYARAEERMKSGDYDLTMGLYWFVPTIIALSYYGIEDQYNSMGAYGGLGFGVTGELTELARAVLLATNNGEFRKAADAFWAANYAVCPTIPFSGRIRTAIHSPDWTGFVFNHNYHVIDLSGVIRK
jgi:ABC-type transport system substrate-binding protein